jgi:hypothetical protein
MLIYNIMLTYTLAKKIILWTMRVGINKYKNFNITLHFMCINLLSKTSRTLSLCVVIYCFKNLIPTILNYI